MGEIHTLETIHRIEYHCDTCKVSVVFVATRGELPPQVHKCKKCQTLYYFAKVYPYQEKRQKRRIGK